ncbi:hypothetical protein ACFQ07_31875 [Actinomadura adrarensis]|uniref:Uncharacterized protein n=1 Tax=Actinomadura adrarensis TaxID=1819600 RepID=A0ABW3CSJ1_9ACTN
MRGGPEQQQSLTEGLELVRRAAYQDSSEGWLCMIANGTAHYLSAYASDELLGRVYTGSNEVYGVVAKVGSVDAKPGRSPTVDGCWRFSSGADRAASMAMGGTREGRPVTVLIDRADLQIEHAWEGPGLLATASHTLRAEGVRVRPEDVVEMAALPPGRPLGIYADSELFLANMPGVPMGLAERLLELLGPALTPASPWQAPYHEAASRTALARRGVTGMLKGFDKLAADGRLAPFAPALRAEYRAILSAGYHVCLDAIVSIAQACDSADPIVRELLADAHLDATTMRPHAAMRPGR